MAFNFRDPNPVLHTLLGTAPAAGGYVQFYERGTTTPKDTWSDPDKGDDALNPNPVPLDASGRFDVPVWLDGEYTAIVYQADGTVAVDAFVILPESGASTALPDPSGQTGKVVVSDGVAYVFEELLRMPDPTGSAGYYVTVDSTGTYYILSPPPAPPVIPEPDITITTTSVTIGDGGSYKHVCHYGTATIPAANAKSSTANITFPNLDKILLVTPVSKTASVTTTGSSADINVSGYTQGSAGSSATLTAVVSEEQGGGSTNKVTNPVTVDWKVEGLVTA